MGNSDSILHSGLRRLSGGSGHGVVSGCPWETMKVYRRSVSGARKCTILCLAMSCMLIKAARGAQGEAVALAPEAVLSSYPGFVSAKVVGDIDDDGYNDLVLTACPADDGVLYAAVAISGRTLRRLNVLSIDCLGAYCASAIEPCGDLDDDGVDDVVVGVAHSDNSRSEVSAGNVMVLSGRSGHVLRRLEGDGTFGCFGLTLGVLGDLDGDSLPECVVGSPGYLEGKPSGECSVFSLRSGRHVRTVAGNGHGDGFGSSICVTGDVDGDGVRDYYVGAPKAGEARGSVSLVSGASGESLYVLAGDEPGDQFGESLALIDDRDGDGLAELAIAAPGSKGGESKPSGRGIIRVVSGKSGIMLLTISPDVREEGGRSIASIDDVDHDGLRDLLVCGNPMEYEPPKRGWLDVVSGGTGKRIVRIQPSWEQGTVEQAMQVGDIDEDGAPDIAVALLETSWHAPRRALSATATGECYQQLLMVSGGRFWPAQGK